jgi:antitoxin CcdA
MRMNIYDPKAPKKAVNLSINSELLAQAREFGVNLSGELEARLEQVLKAKRWARWQEENREAIENHNRRIREHGLWSDGLRQF